MRTEEKLDSISCGRSIMSTSPSALLTANKGDKLRDKEDITRQSKRTLRLKELRQQEKQNPSRSDASIKKLKAEMKEISEEQKCIKKEQRKTREKFEEIRSEYKQLRVESQVIALQNSVIKLKLTLCFEILKARGKKDFITADILVLSLRLLIE